MTMKTQFILLALVMGCAMCPQPGFGASYGPTSLTSDAGRRFVGDQLKAFDVNNDVIGGTSEGWITLQNTEKLPFRLTGDVWLAGPPQKIPFPSDMPDGVGFFIRQQDGMHRYSVTPDRLLVKRLRYDGILAKTIVTVHSFGTPRHRTWIPFTLEAREEKIVFRTGEKVGTIKGPLDMEGSNMIALGKGSKLRNLRLELLSK